MRTLADYILLLALIVLITVAALLATPLVIETLSPGSISTPPPSVTPSSLPSASD